MLKTNRTKIVLTKRLFPNRLKKQLSIFDMSTDTEYPVFDPFSESEAGFPMEDERTGKAPKVATSVFGLIKVVEWSALNELPFKDVLEALDLAKVPLIRFGGNLFVKKIDIEKALKSHLKVLAKNRSDSLSRSSLRLKNKANESAHYKALVASVDTNEARQKAVDSLDLIVEAMQDNAESVSVSTLRMAELRVEYYDSILEDLARNVAFYNKKVQDVRLPEDIIQCQENLEASFLKFLYSKFDV